MNLKKNQPEKNQPEKNQPDQKSRAAGTGPEGRDAAGRQGAPPSAGRNAAGRISGEAVTSLGSLEAEIMGLVWDAGRPVHGMEVAEASLYRRREQGREPIAFSTVATTLRRLSEKGMLTVGRRPNDAGLFSKREARTPYYAPTVGREAMAARILDSVSRTLLGRSMHALIPHLTGGPGNTGGRGKEQADAQERLHRLMEALEEAARSEDGDAE